MESCTGFYGQRLIFCLSQLYCVFPVTVNRELKEETSNCLRISWNSPIVSRYHKGIEINFNFDSIP